MASINDKEQNKEIDELRMQLYNYQNYVMKLPIYEYHIDKIKVEKVKGILQLGQLLDGKEMSRKGIHKVFIQELIIREIEESGIVGIGLTEKDVKKDKKKQTIPPKKASKEIKLLYNKIKKELNLHEVPILFQQLAVKKEVLEKLWNFINGNKSFQYKVNTFGNNVQTQIEKAASELLNDKPPYDLIQNEMICEKISKEIADLSKTYGIVVILLNQLLPGYVEDPNQFSITINKLGLVDKANPNKVFKRLQEGYHLSLLSETFKKLQEHPITLLVVYNELFIPLNKGENDRTFLERMHAYVKQKLSWSEFPKIDIDLNIEQRSFLYTVMMQNFTDIPKWVYLDIIIYYFCNPKEKQQDE